MKPAVFLDRDGTIIEQVHYIRDPADVRLISGAAEAIARLRTAGFACVAVSNQSAVGRGIMTIEDVDRVQREVDRQLAQAGAALDGWYFCPVAPPAERTNTERAIVDHPDRKPGPGMLLRAARELDLDLASSWMVGDMLSDLHAGRNAGVRGAVLVRTGHGETVGDPGGAAGHVAPDLLHAAQWILSCPQSGAAGAADGPGAWKGRSCGSC